MAIVDIDRAYRGRVVYLRTRLQADTARLKLLTEKWIVATQQIVMELALKLSNHEAVRHLSGFRSMAIPAA